MGWIRAGGVGVLGGAWDNVGGEQGEAKGGEQVGRGLGLGLAGRVRGGAGWGLVETGAKGLSCCGGARRGKELLAARMGPTLAEAVQWMGSAVAGWATAVGSAV